MSEPRPTCLQQFPPSPSIVVRTILVRDIAVLLQYQTRVAEVGKVAASHEDDKDSMGCATHATADRCPCTNLIFLVSFWVNQNTADKCDATSSAVFPHVQWLANSCCGHDVTCMHDCLCLAFLLAGKPLMGAPRAQSFAVAQGRAVPTFKAPRAVEITASTSA